MAHSCKPDAICGQVFHNCAGLPINKLRILMESQDMRVANRHDVSEFCRRLGDDRKHSFVETENAQLRRVVFAVFARGNDHAIVSDERGTGFIGVNTVEQAVSIEM
jgi:hypothetical protein